MQKSSEQFYLHRIRTFQDERAFARLYEAHAKGIYRFLCIRLPSPQDAEDVLSITFVRLWDYLVRSSNVEHVSALVHTIARAAVADFYRGSAQKTAALTDTSTEALDGASDVGKEARHIEAQTDVALLKEAINTLPETMRDALILRFFEGKSIAAVADALEKNEGATRVLLHRALKRLHTTFVHT